MRSERDEAGMVTAELAASLPVLVLLLAVALSVVSVASARLQAEDAAREAARAAARSGDGVSVGREVAPGAQVQLSQAGASVRAVITLRANLLVPFLPSVEVTEQAVAAREGAGSAPSRVPP
jgi:Flp pilus assembly protein TadG